MFVGQTKEEDGETKVRIRWSNGITAWVLQSLVRFFDAEGDNRRRRRRATKPIYEMDAPVKRKERPKKEGKKKKENADVKHPPSQPKKKASRRKPKALRLNAGTEGEQVEPPPKKARRRKPKQLRLAVNADLEGVEKPAHDATATTSSVNDTTHVKASTPENVSHPPPASATSSDPSKTSAHSTTPTENNTLAALNDHDAIPSPTLLLEKEGQVINSSFELSFDPESSEEEEPKDSLEETEAVQIEPKPQNIGAEAAVAIPSLPKQSITANSSTTTQPTTAANAEPQLQSENSDEEVEWQNDRGKEMALPAPKKNPIEANATTAPTDGKAGESSTITDAVERTPVKATAAVAPAHIEVGESSNVTETLEAKTIPAIAAVVVTESEVGESPTTPTETVEAKSIQATAPVVPNEIEAGESLTGIQTVEAKPLPSTAPVGSTEKKAEFYPATVTEPVAVPEKKVASDQASVAVASTDEAAKAPRPTPVHAPPPKSPPRSKLCMEHYDLSDRDTFPGQLFRLLRDAHELGIHEIISWENDGETFRMHNEKKFLGLLLKLSHNKKVISFRNTLGQFNFQCVEFGANGRAFRHASAIPGRFKNDATNENTEILFHKDATTEQIQRIKRRASGMDHRKPSSLKKNGGPPLSMDTTALKRMAPKKTGSPTLSLDKKSLERMARARSSQAQGKKLDDFSAHSNDSTKSSPDKSVTSDNGRNKRRRDPVFDLLDNPWAAPYSKRRKRWLMAKEGSTERLEDGTWTKPKGKPPALSLEWDKERGMWETVRKDVVDTTAATSAPAKRADQSRGPPKKRKPVAVQRSDDAGESVPRNKLTRQAERETRRRSDGCLYPKTRPIRNEDGTFAKPGGAAPKGLVWDTVRGLWAPKGKAVSNSQSESPARDSWRHQRSVRPDLPTSVSIRQPARAPHKEQTVVEVAPSGKHHVLRESPLYPSFLMFKKRHLFRGKFTARTKANPTGIIGGDNEFMKDIKKDNWARMHRLIKKRAFDEREEELSHNTNSSFSSGESTLVAHPQVADVDIPMADADYPMADENGAEL